MNGRTLDIEDEGLLSVVDRAGIATANLNDVRGALKKAIRNV